MQIAPYLSSRRAKTLSITGLLRSLGRLGGGGVPVYAMVEDSYAPLTGSRYVTKTFVWTEKPVDRGSFIREICRVRELIPQRPMLIPSDDLSAVFVAEEAEFLNCRFVLPQSSSDLCRKLANKESFYSLCESIGVPCPRSIVPGSIEHVFDFVAQTSFPVVVKAVDQWALLGDGQNALIVNDLETLLNLFNQEGDKMLLQEYVPGKHWLYNGYCNSQVGIYLGFTGRKLASYPPQAGATALGISTFNEVLLRQSEDLLRSVSYCGMVDMDWQYDVRDGRFKILDCNPRVGMNFGLFETKGGIDVVRAQHLDLTGRSFEHSSMLEGRQLRVETAYVLGFLRHGRINVENEGTSPGETKDIEYAWWSSDDWRPFFIMIVRLLVRTFARSLKKVMDIAGKAISHRLRRSPSS